MLNEAAETGNYADEIKRSGLVPLLKPRKRWGPQKISAQHTTVLLFMFKKVQLYASSYCIEVKIHHQMHLSQSAYRPDRGTTEQIFVIKAIAGMASTSTKLSADLLMMNKSI